MVILGMKRNLQKDRMEKEDFLNGKTLSLPHEREISS